MKNTTIFKTSNSGKNLRFWHFCLMLYALFSVTGGYAQGTISVGSGTANSSFYMPVRAYYGYSYTQQIVTASEYAAGGGVAGNITKIRYYISTAEVPLNTWNNWTIYIGHTSKTAFANTTDWEPAANLTQVFSGTVTQASNSWMEITLTTPFAYNGTSNLVIGVDENAPLYTSGINDTYFGSYTSAANTGIYYYNDTTNPNPASPPTANGRTSTLPRIQFVGAVASCLPPTSVVISGTSATSATATLTAPSSAPSGGYDYYISTTNTAPTTATTGNVSGTTISLGSLTANTTYYLWVRGNCGSGSTSLWSGVTTFTTACDPQNIPYTQDFESVTTPQLPECTSVQNAGSGNNWETNSPAAYGFSNKALRYAYNTAAAANVWFFTKGLNLTANTSYRITYKYGSAGFSEKMKVAYGTSPTAAAMTLPLADHNGFTTSPLTNTVDFTPAASGVYYFGFNAYSVANQFWIFLDDISITLTPTCLAPTALTSATVSTTSGTVSWTAPSTAPANGYEYYTSTTNTAPTASTVVSGSVAAGVTTATIGGLAPNTTNYVWVRSNCTASDQSTWSGPTSFYTGYCTPAPSSVDGTGITNVTLGGINNTTAGETGNYGNYSAITGSGALGSTVNFSITLNSCDTFSCYTYGTKIWIDWNNDLDFSDAGELVYTGLSGSTAPIILTGSFVVPANASLAGNHRMRIGATDNDSGPADACYTGTYGTFEDYTFNAFMPPAPVVTSFTPATYCAASGVITITGTDLGNATLTVGTTPVTITTNTATQIVATVAAGVSGPVTVTTVGGTTTTADSFAVTAPTAIVLSATSDAICVGQTSDPVTITSGAAAFDTFEWSPLAGVSGTAATGFTFSPAATTTYTLTASNAVSGCVTTTTFTVNVNVLPTALVLPDSAAVCEGGSAVAIQASGATTMNTILAENFNGASNNWTTANNGTGGTVANAAWTLRADGYQIPSYNVVHSNDNSQFYLSNSDSQGSGSTTSVILASPAFSTVGYSSVNVSFYHFYQQWQTSTAKVEASVDGTAWTTLQTYSANTGTYTAFASANIALTNAFLNQPVVYIRFKFDASWGYFWAIDNVAISGQQGADITWSPQAGLYTDAAATVAYTGQAASTVYAKPTATTAYTATATNPSGCFVTDAVEVMYHNTPAPAADALQTVCSGSTIASLEATGSGISWYAAATGGNALAANTVLVDGATYYAAQVADGCQSVTRTAVMVDLTVTPAPTVADDTQTFCGSGTVSQIVATGTGLKWYTTPTGGNAVAETSALTPGVTVYYGSQTIDGCESSARTAVAVLLNVTDAPQAAAQQTFCNMGTVAGLMATGSGVQWYSDATGGTALASSAALTDGGVYYASQTMNGCESMTRTMVTVSISTPDAPDAEAAQTFCNSATVADLMATGEGIQWYSAETGGTALAATTPLMNGMMYYASRTVNGCESATRTMVTATVNMTAAPVVAVALQSFCNSATVADLDAEGTDIQWYTSATGGNAMAADGELMDGMLYYASQTVNGCESTQRATVAVSINTVADLTGDAQQTITVGNADDATIEDLVVDGNGYVTWYPTEEDALAGTNAIEQGTTLVSGDTYYAMQTVGNCTSMNVFAVTVDVTLGGEQFNAAAFQYYPNPVKDVLNVSYSSDITSVSVFNMLGQQVISLQPAATQAKVDMSSLADGAYIMKVTAGNAVKTIKVMKKQ
ncbi:hypothetical protein HYN59_11180 [Flavobacterium album]|uniref:Fibronectin type-III domain-containing protein n=1 Tax=Flavobacterium album TaxID=2175091 RepID=A0A2S1QZ40_9FLAO|nr:GEVED domain-containing protein [Flavobacterium album]AWH85634.1 hypothetical protein HYN59_11180 [Flavobacterium album]